MKLLLLMILRGNHAWGRWSDGLHQAIEAKEMVPIQDESQTLASITYQNCFYYMTNCRE